MPKRLANKHILLIVLVLVVAGAYFYFFAPAQVSESVEPEGVQSVNDDWKRELEQYFVYADALEQSETEREVWEEKRGQVVLVELEALNTKYNGAINFMSQAHTAPEKIIAEPDTAAGPDVWISYSNQEFGFTMTRPAMSMVVQEVDDDGSEYLRIMHAAYKAYGTPAHFIVQNVSFGHEDLLAYVRSNWGDGDSMNFILEKDETTVEGDVTIRTIEHATAYGLGQGYRLLEQEGKPVVLITYTPVQQVVEMVEKLTLL
jgi:hypothetical protein